MANEHEETNSIWASRTSPESVAFPSFAPRRARAGTLPSRLPSRIDTAARDPPSAHLGSLALISPDGNDIVYDSIPPSSRSAVGQQPGFNSTTPHQPVFAQPPGSHPITGTSQSLPSNGINGFMANGGEKRRSPPLAPIPEPTSVDSIGNPSSAPFPSNAPPSVHSSSAIASGATLAPPTNNLNRGRSGSLNSLAMRTQRPFVPPFSSSIWGPGSRTPLQATSSGSSAVGGSSTLGSSATSSMGSDLTDPMILFSNELNKAANPPRIRSYTLDGAAAGGASAANDWTSSQSHPALQFAQRARAQTLMMPQGGVNGSANNLSSQNLSTSTLGQQQTQQPQHSRSLHEQPQNLFVTGDFSPTPTPAISISNVPPQASQQTLKSLFGPFGKIEMVRIVTNRRLAYVVFASTIQAIEAQATANGAELYVGNGPSAVSFTQLTSPNASVESFHVPSGAMSNNGVSASIPNSLHPGFNAASKVPGQPTVAYPRHTSPETRQQQSQVMAQSEVPLPVTAQPAPVSVAYILQTLNADRNEIQSGIEHLQRASVLTFDAPIKPLSESLAVDPGSADKTYNAAVLRDIRRRLETMPTKEVEEVALDMQRELPALASDYIGNTAVQLVFERSGPEVRDMMLRRLVSVFAATGTHKNGTWAVQKMIDLARGPRHYSLIEEAIRPHLVALLLDQFGNYVVQGCLKFGTPSSDFVYSGIASALAKIAPNRFGARAIRAVLESEHTTAANQRLVATAIVQQIASLATNPNGCLLVSWLLDNFERSDPDMHLRTHSLVAAQLVPQHLAAMCSSKLGSGIVLKLAASPSSSSHRVFDALLEPLTDRLPGILVDVLEDPSGQGASCVYRLMTTVFPPQSLERQVTMNKVRMCLLRPGARIPNHKRLLEEVGLNMLHPEVKETTGMMSNGSSGSSGSNESHHEPASPPEDVPMIHASQNNASDIVNVEF